MAVNLDFTPKKIEDSVRALPANQGKNDWDMWQLVDTAIAAAATATTLNANKTHKSGNAGDTHGAK